MNIKKQPTDIIREWYSKKKLPTLFIYMICIADKNQKNKQKHI